MEERDSPTEEVFVVQSKRKKEKSGWAGHSETQNPLPKERGPGWPRKRVYDVCTSVRGRKGEGVIPQ